MMSFSVQRVMRRERLQAVSEAPAVLDVLKGRKPYSRDLGRGERPDDLRRRTHDQASRRKDLIFCHQRIGAHEAVFTDPATVEQRRTHADQAVVTDDCAMDDRTVADRDTLADRYWPARVDMYDGAILDIAATTNIDQIVVATQHGAEPDRYVTTYIDVSDQLRILGNEAAGSIHEDRYEIIQCMNRHGHSLSDCGASTSRLRPDVFDH